jgi:hypothetical protein
MVDGSQRNMSCIQTVSVARSCVVFSSLSVARLGEAAFAHNSHLVQS